MQSSQLTAHSSAMLLRAQLRLRLALGMVGALLAALLLAGILLATVLLPRDWRLLGTAAELRRAEPQLLYVQGHELYLVWDGALPRALSTRDPHRGVCVIRWLPAHGVFADPCGGSAYQPNGDYLRGPAPRSMDRYAARMVGDMVEVNLGELTPGARHY